MTLIHFSNKEKARPKFMSLTRSGGSFSSLKTLVVSLTVSWTVLRCSRPTPPQTPKTTDVMRLFGKEKYFNNDKNQSRCLFNFCFFFQLVRSNCEIKKQASTKKKKQFISLNIFRLMFCHSPVMYNVHYMQIYYHVNKLMSPSSQ